MSVSPREGVGLAGLTTLGVGGPARWFLTAATADDVRDACTWCRDRGVSVHLLGGGSNVVVADAGTSTEAVPLEPVPFGPALLDDPAPGE